MKTSLRLLFLSIFLITQTLPSDASFGKKKEKEMVMKPNTEAVPDEAVKNAFTEFKSLTRKERKERINEAKKEIEKFKEAKKAGAEPETSTILLAILAILLPPLAVFLHQGEINGKFWLSLILTLLFFLPGVIYALLVIFGNA